MSHAQAAPTDVVRVTGLVKRYRELVALDHLDLAVRRGEIFGLLGPNGSGKTTAINCILQLLSYDRGTIELFGEPMAPGRYDLKARVGVVPQQVAVFDEPTVAVDPQSRANILDGICRLRDEGATVVYTSHYMEEVEQICGRIMICDRGRAVAQGTADELKRMISLGEKITAEVGELSEGTLERLRGLAHVLSADCADGMLRMDCAVGPVPVALVTPAAEKDGAPAGSFEQVVDALAEPGEDQLLDLRRVETAGEAEDLLAAGEIDGYFELARRDGGQPHDPGDRRQLLRAVAGPSGGGGAA